MRIENLLGAGKNIGTTHITNGGYRLHPVEWNIGEAAGRLPPSARNTASLPHAVHASAEETTEFQRELAAAGVELRWPAVPR